MSLYFIDCTGSYRVRAFAIGNQSIQVNKKLRGIDLQHHTKEQAIECIIQLLTSPEDDDANNEDTIKPLPKNTLFEIATMDITTGLVERMRRKIESAVKINT
jgi:20S proteasome alpha/beta subunit